MPRESVHEKLGRVKPPRVHITYDVEVGDAIEKKEIPFVMGILGDFSGKADSNLPQPRFKDRKFVEITPDNFDRVLKAMNPHASFEVNDKLSGKPDAQLHVDLRFEKLEDFEPELVAKKVEPLNKLLELRTKLADLRGSLQGNEKLDDLLLESVSNTEKLENLRAQLNPPKAPEGGSND